MSFGFLISALCDSQAVAMQLSIGSFYPNLLLSGKYIIYTTVERWRQDHFLILKLGIKIMGIPMIPSIAI